MTITKQQRDYARVAAILVFVKHILEFGGDFPTIMQRTGKSFAENAQWAAESQTLYRIALAEVTCAWIALGVLGFALYVVLEPVHKRRAQLALVMMLGASFVGAASMMFRMAVAWLYALSAKPELFTLEQLRMLVSTAQRAANIGIETAWIMQGTALMLFFLLLLRSRLVPRAIAGLGVVGSPLLVGASIVMMIVPALNMLKLLGVPGLLAQLAMAVWILVRGLGPRESATLRAVPQEMLS